MPDLSSLSFNEKVLYIAAIVSIFAIVLSLLGAGVSLIFGLRVNFDQKRELLNLTADNLATAERLEKERLIRLDLEATMAPRLVVITPQVKARLGAFEGTPYVLEFDPGDNETQRAAGQLVSVLTEAKWRRIALIPDATIIGPVRIQTNEDSPGNIPRAQSELALYLLAMGWDTQDVSIKVPERWKELRAKLGVKRLAGNTVRIQIGAKIPEYFLDTQLIPLMDERIRSDMEELRTHKRTERMEARKGWGLSREELGYE